MRKSYPDAYIFARTYGTTTVGTCISLLPNSSFAVAVEILAAIMPRPANNPDMHHAALSFQRCSSTMSIMTVSKVMGGLA